VAEGHYDLIGPNGDIILPQVWETVIEPNDFNMEESLPDELFHSL
jgi:hypothetical protein